MKNSKLKISEFEKYSLSTKSQTIIRGGLPDGWLDPNDLDGDGNPDDPNNPGTPGGTGGPRGTPMISVNIKEETVDQIKPTTQYFTIKP